MLNSEKSASLAGSRPNSSINRQNKTASRSHVTKVLVDAINSHGGEMLLEKLLDVSKTLFRTKDRKLAVLLVLSFSLLSVGGICYQ